MKIKKYHRDDLITIDIDAEGGRDLAAVCATIARHISIVPVPWAVNARLWRVLTLASDEGTWRHWLNQTTFADRYDVDPVTEGVYGNVEIIGADESGMVYWIERAAAPTEELLTGEGAEVYQVSHLNPIGGTESEPVRADSRLAAVEKYAAFMFGLYGTAHHIAPDGLLCVVAKDARGDEETFQVAKDSTISTPPGDA